MAHVILGVIDRWQETREKRAGADPVSPYPTTFSICSSRTDKGETGKSTKDQAEREPNNGKKVLQTVPEDDEILTSNLPPDGR